MRNALGDTDQTHSLARGGRRVQAVRARIAVWKSQWTETYCHVYRLSSSDKDPKFSGPKHYLKILYSRNLDQAMHALVLT